jgi:hypothetical protein
MADYLASGNGAPRLEATNRLLRQFGTTRMAEGVNGLPEGPVPTAHERIRAWYAERHLPHHGQSAGTARRRRVQREARRRALEQQRREQREAQTRLVGPVATLAQTERHWYVKVMAYDARRDLRRRVAAAYRAMGAAARQRQVQRAIAEQAAAKLSHATTLATMRDMAQAIAAARPDLAREFIDTYALLIAEAGPHMTAEECTDYAVGQILALADGCRPGVQRSIYAAFATHPEGAPLP